MNAEQIKALLDGATPGSWRPRMTSYGPIDIVAPDGRDILVMYGKGVDEKTADNARLIAAAPDLAQAALTAMAERDALQARHDDDRQELSRMTAENEVLQARVAELEKAGRAIINGDERGQGWQWQDGMDDLAALLKGTPDAKA